MGWFSVGSIAMKLLRRCTFGMAVKGAIGNPFLLASQTARLVKVGDYIYTGSDSGRFIIIDVSDPADPTIVGHVIDITHMSDIRWGIVVEGNYAYVGDGSDGWLNVIDVSDKENPTIIASVKHPNSSSIIAEFVKDGDFLYGVDWGMAAIFVVDVSNPASPSFVGWLEDSVNFPQDEWGLIKEGDYLYTTGYSTASMMIYDVSNPASITLEGVVTSATYFGEPYAGMVKDGDYVYGVGMATNSLVVFDVSNKSAPFVAGGVTSGILDEPQVGILKDGDLIYATGYESASFVVIDVSDPTTPTIIGWYADLATFDAPWGVPFKFQNYVLATAYWGGGLGGGPGVLAAFDVTDPTSPQYQALSAAGYFEGSEDMIVDGNYAYIKGFRSDSFAVVALCVEDHGPLPPPVVG